MSTVAVVYLTNPLAFETLGSATVAERFVQTLLEVRNIDDVYAVIADNRPAELDDWFEANGVPLCHVPANKVAAHEAPFLCDHHCVDAFAYCMEKNPRVVVACVPYFPFLPAAKIEMCVRKLSHYAWAGPSRCWPAVIPHPKGGMRRTAIDGYLGGVRAFKAGLRNEGKPWDNKFGGVECDAAEALNMGFDADRRLAQALVG